MGEPVLITDANGLPVIFNCFLAQKPGKNRLTFGTREAKRDRKPTLKHAGNTVIACATGSGKSRSCDDTCYCFKLELNILRRYYTYGMLHFNASNLRCLSWIVVGRFLGINKYLLFFSFFHRHLLRVTDIAKEQLEESNAVVRLKYLVILDMIRNKRLDST